MEFESKTQLKNMEFADCHGSCGMSKGSEGIRQRITMTAMRTYSKLAVSGDICSIKGLSYGEKHGIASTMGLTRREGSPVRHFLIMLKRISILQKKRRGFLLFFSSHRIHFDSFLITDGFVH